MASKEVWENWHSASFNKGSDEDILSMIQDVVEAIHSLERMYGHKAAQLTVRGLFLDYQALAGIAFARELYHHERP